MFSIGQVKHADLVSLHAFSRTFACANKPRCIPSPGGTLVGTTCSWERKLCVTCRDDGGVVKIRVQTNNMPDHCMNSIQIKPQNFDYEVMYM